MTAPSMTSDRSPAQDRRLAGPQVQNDEEIVGKIYGYGTFCAQAIKQYVDVCPEKFDHSRWAGVYSDLQLDKRVAFLERQGGWSASETLKSGDQLVLSSLADAFSTIGDLTWTLSEWLRRGIDVWVIELGRHLTNGDLRLLRAATFSQRTRRTQSYWRIPPNPQRFVGYGIVAKYDRSKRSWRFRTDAAARETQALILRYFEKGWASAHIATVLNLSKIRTWGKVGHGSGLTRRKRVNWNRQRVVHARMRELELREFERDPAAYAKSLGQETH